MISISVKLYIQYLSLNSMITLENKLYANIRTSELYSIYFRDPLITQSDLDNIADYIVPKDELCGRLIVVDF